MKRYLLALIVTAAAACGGTASAQSSPGRTGDPSRGRDLARKYCSTCHLFPEPDLLTKTAWIHHVQPEMAKWAGLERVDFEGIPDGKILQEAGIYPSAALMPEEDWFAIWDYYRAAAPSRPVPQPAKPAVARELKQFRARKLNPAPGAPMITLVRIDAANRRLFAGDGFVNLLFALDPAGDVIGRVRLEGGPVSMSSGATGTYFGLIGRLFPSDALEGAVLFVPRGTSGQPTTVLEKLRRPTDAVAADLNQDGREDLVVCQFGNRLGQFSWFENRGGGRYEEHVLLDRPGAVQAAVRDFNGDGRPDVLVLMAQAREAVVLFVNEGQGRFRPETLLEAPPTWGFAGLELADFNGDGRPDLVTANGDNGDFALPLKSYHGIRVYLNDGTNHLREVFFYPMHGAYKAVARDFDGDGDLDIAAIAFYPDFTAAAPESFVYLENQGGWKFTASTLDESNSGRWMVMDAGDLDGDGDDDIALGSLVRGPTTMPVPLELRDRWRTNGAAVLLLENLGKRR